MIRIASLLLVLAACTPTQPTQFYTLTSWPSAPEASIAFAGANDILAIAPIVLPAYLERPQMVVRLDRTRMRLAEFDNWIEPLDTLIQRTLAANLNNGASIGQVVRLPQRRSVPFDFGIEVMIDRFETTGDGMAWIDASWIIIDTNENEIARQRFLRQLPIAPPLGFAQHSLALSELLALLSGDLLSAIETVQADG